MALEEMGMYFRSLNQYQQEPFDLTFNAESMPTGGEIAMMPVKMSLGYNLTRSAWWGSKAIGMNPFSKLTNPFNPAHLQWRYRAKSMKGFSARLLEGIGSKVGGVRSWVTGTAPDTEQAIPWYRRAVYSMEKDNVLLKEIAEGKGAPNAVKSMGIGALDRYLLRPYEMHNSISKVHSAFRTAVSANELGEMMLTNLYEASALRGTKGQKIAISAKTMGQFMGIRTDLVSDYKGFGFKGYNMFDDIATPMSPAEEILGSGKVSSLVSKFDFGTVDYQRGLKGRKDFLRISRGSKVSMFDLMTGRAEGFEKQIGEGYFKSRWRYAKENVSFGYDDDTRKKLSLYHSRSKSTRKLYQQYTMAQDKTYHQAAIKAAQQSSDDVAQQFKTYVGFMDDMEKSKLAMQRQTFRVIDRLKTSRYLKAGLGIATGLTTAAWLTKTIVQGALALPGRIAGTVQDLVRPEFGSGEVLSNARVSTERQRAVQAIQNAHMNARYLLGGEAGMYH